VPGSGTGVGVVTVAAALAELRERMLLSEKPAALVIPVHSIPGDAGHLIGERNGKYVAVQPQAEVTHVRKDYSRPDQAADRRNWSSVTQDTRHLNEPPAHVLAALFISSVMFSCYG
jgi:hypothetical protein